MIELVKQSYLRQFEAVLSKLYNTMVLCPSDQWERKVGDYGELVERLPVGLSLDARRLNLAQVDAR